MTKEMVISANRHETKVAILEDDQLVEVYFQRANEYSLAGSIHKGRVTRVLPGMQSAFVDLGLERDTFLYVTDFFEENEDYDKLPSGGESRQERGERPRRDDRGQRPPREDRASAAAMPEPASEAEPAPPEPVAAPGPVSDVAEAAVPEPGVSEATAPQRDGDRDRHRRSRRRRNRGRGFPESKYAVPERGGAALEPVEPVPPSEGSAEDFDFPVLPGESLAKYRHTAVQTLDEGEQEELGAASAGAEHTVDQATPEADAEEEVPGTLEASLPERPPITVNSEAPSAAVEDVTAIDRREPVGADGEAAEIDELLAEARAEAAEESHAVASPRGTGVVEAAETPVTQTEESTPGTGAEQSAAEGGDANAQVSAGEQAEAEPEAGAESEGEYTSTGQPSAAEPAGPAEAAVREQGGRYMHRVSRRLRRKMRSQPPGGHGRPEAEPRHDREQEPTTAVAVAPQPAKADTRTVLRADKGAAPLITDLLKEAQEIIVQIAKEPLGQKGARITSHIALPGRYVVYMPTLDHMGVSRKIASDEERLRLKRILQNHRAGIAGGFIVRTAGEGKSEEDIAADMNFLANLWLDIRQKAEKRPAPALLHHDLDIVQRLLRDQLNEAFKAVWVDNEDMYESILHFVQRFQPALVSKVKLYTRPAPIFDAFNISPELEKALRPKVWLKSGGYIVINQTEALVAIDVNTGKYVGKSNRLEDTIVRTNTEAVKEIVRQIRLRDLGGIIVVDFIDMDERKNRQKVMQALEEAMRADKAPYKILQFNDFGLVAITRKRVKQSLERALCMPCTYCEGAGYVKSVPTIIGEILQEAHKIARAVEGDNLVLRVNPEVAKTLKSNRNRYLEELEEILRRPVLVKADPLLHHEKFDLA